MAVFVYCKTDSGEIKKELVAPGRLPSLLANGYTVTKEELEVPTFEEADTNDSGKLSNKEVREAAKEAGFDDWETARIKGLKERLGYGE